MRKILAVTVWSWIQEDKKYYHGGIVFPLDSKGLATVKRKWYQLNKTVVCIIKNFLITI